MLIAKEKKNFHFLQARKRNDGMKRVKMSGTEAIVGEREDESIYLSPTSRRDKSAT